MYKRLSCYIIFALAVLCIVYTSSLRGVPTIGAVVQTWRYDAATNNVIATIVNTSDKDITAFNLTITETFADHGVRTHEVLVDMLDTLLLLQRVKGTSDEDRVRKDVGDGVLVARRSRDQVFSYPEGKVVTDFSATVDVVAYADNTAESVNAPALARIREHRNAELHSHQKASEIIKTVLLDSSITSPSQEAATRLEKFLAVWKGQSHSSGLDFDPGSIESVARDLKDASRIATAQGLSEMGFLQKYVAEKDQYIAFLSTHNQLKTGGVQ